ncbi:glycosyltransferase [Labrys sedimenti]|uniref:glycosyltransferase n=1 Tax=Labrys sedimenti TaxID=3106036 RepID=UPI002ACA05D8|nr:glycosyltransferase [Labrys sp. ZIDIC5]MDZ5454228.1 glycosyltransferase [Labrys sp. ZIDIC5]
MTLRCLHVVPTYLPALRYGGPIHAVHGLCRALAGQGCDVQVYTTNVDGDDVLPVPTDRPVQLDGVNVHYFPAGLGRRLYRSPAMGRALAQNIASFDVVHLHSVFLWPTTAAARLARRHAIPYLLAPRGMLVGPLIRRKSRLLKSAWIQAFDRANLAGAAAVHVTSRSERLEIEKLGLPARAFALVPNGIDMPPAGTDLLLPDQARPYALFLGRISWKKGIERLIDAMQFVGDADLVIAGNDDEGETARLKARAAALGLDTRIRFVGPVHGEEKWSLLRNCAAFALASHSENFGNAVLEAMACARPVIVTPEVGLADAVADAGCGLVVEGSAAALGAALSSLLADPDLAARLGQAGEKTAREQFSWPGIARAMLDVYQEAILARAGQAALAGSPLHV